MKKPLVLFAILLLTLGGPALAGQVKDLEQAKTLSAESGKPILLEFVHED